MTDGCRCGEQCYRCGGCRAQHNTKEKRERLGCRGYVARGSSLARILERGAS